MQYISAKGAKFPALGFGTWPLSGAAGRRAIADALAVGYRHIDTAQMYGNEAEVGAAIKESRVDRADIWVTTKIDNSSHAAAAVKRSTEESLRKLGGLIDLLLIHWPVKGVPVAETLDAMAAFKDSGKVRHIGVSNFNVALIEEAAAHYPELLCNQVEYHPFLSQRSVLATVRKHGMFLTAYQPLAHGAVSKDATIAGIAKRLGKTAAQVTLRWLIEQDAVAAIPKAGSRAHMEENFAIFDFALSAADRAAIDKMGSPSGRRLDFAGVSPAWDRE